MIEIEEYNPGQTSTRKSKQYFDAERTHKMKRLFTVIGGGVNEVLYFDKKTDAKKLRDEHIAAGHGACVSKGPDHAEYKVVRPNSTHPKRTRSAAKKS